MEVRMIRVGEGYYSPMKKMSPEEREVVDKVLREMREVTSKVTINGQEEGEQEP
mgnify:FL=1